jgi:nucleoside-diphosphate-sugar epimerase
MLGAQPSWLWGRRASCLSRKTLYQARRPVAHRQDACTPIRRHSPVFALIPFGVRRSVFDVLPSMGSQVHVLAVVHRRKVEITDAEVELLHGGLEACIRDPTGLRSAQVVLHMAAVTHTDNPSEYFQVNTELTKRLLSVCDPHQHFVYVSTICAHPDGGRLRTLQMVGRRSGRGSGLGYTVIRPAEIYGSRDDEGIDALIALARKVRIMPDFRYGGSIKYAPINAQEAAQFIAEATICRRRKGQTYTLCAGRSCTAREMAPVASG